MASVGSILRECRAAKGCSLAKAGADTHILPRYIEALEEGCFGDLPGSVYCQGFIKNLAKYYGVDAGELVSLYKSETCIDQAPEPAVDVPVQKAEAPKKRVMPSADVAKPEKVEKPEKSARAVNLEGSSDHANHANLADHANHANLANLAKLSALLLAAIVALLLVFKLGGRSEPDVSKAKENVSAAFVMDEVFCEREFSGGDTISVKLGDAYSDVLCKIEGDGVVLSSNSGDVGIKSGEEAVLDLDGDGKDDVKVIARSVDQGRKTAVLRMDKALEGPVSPPVSVIQVAASPDSVVRHGKGETKLFNSPAKGNFVVAFEFKESCYLRYQFDSDEMVEKKYKKGERLELEVSEGIKLWVANAGAARIFIGACEIVLGDNGSASCEKILWKEGADKSYDLLIVSMH